MCLAAFNNWIVTLLLKTKKMKLINLFLLTSLNECTI